MGPDRQRWQQNYSGNGMFESTFYAGKLLEIESAGSAYDYRHYIYAGNQPVAIVSD